MDAASASTPDCAPMGPESGDSLPNKPLSAHEAGKLASHAKVVYAPSTPPERPGGLTIREEEIALLLTQDYSYKEIGQKVGIGIGTVKSHVHNILGKIKGRSRASIIIWQLRRQLADRDREILILKELLAKGGSSAAPER